MSVTAVPLLEAKLVEATATTQYTSTNMVTIIDKFTAYNGDPAAQTLVVQMVPPSGTPANGNVIVFKTLQPTECYTFPEIVGHIINKGGFIAAYATKASVISIRVSGRQVT